MWELVTWMEGALYSAAKWIPSWVTVEAQLIVRESRSIPFRLIKHESVPVPSPINDLRPDAPQLIKPFNYCSLDHAAASVKSIVDIDGIVTLFNHRREIAEMLTRYGHSPGTSISYFT